MTTHFDAIIIGTGQSGPALAARLSAAGKRVAIIERKLFGGTCVNTGCIPTKTLVASAYAAHLVRRATEYGVTVGGPMSVDMKRVKARKDEISGRSNRNVEKWMRGLENGTVYQGHARFESPHTVRVNGDLLEGDKIFINVGGRALVPPMPGVDQVPYLTNSSMMEYVKVDDQLRTNVHGIWALGDCNGRGAFTHTSYNDFEIAAANVLDNDPRKVSDRIATYGLFIDPPLGRAGMTEAEVRQSGRTTLVATRPMTRVGRAVEKGEAQGFMKAIVDAETKEILGAAILGVTGDEVIHSLLDVMYAKAPYTVITRAVHIHPTVSELVPTMLGELRPLA